MLAQYKVLIQPLAALKAALTSLLLRKMCKTGSPARRQVVKPLGFQSTEHPLGQCSGFPWLVFSLYTGPAVVSKCWLLTSASPFLRECGFCWPGRGRRAAHTASHPQTYHYGLVSIGALCSLGLATLQPRVVPPWPSS